MMLRFFFLMILALILNSQLIEPLYGKVSSEKNKLNFYVWTVGLGPRMEARYGHTILRFNDPRIKSHRNINWGMFNFRDPYLPLNFFLGKLRYWVDEEYTGKIIRRYQQYEKRPVIGNKLMLTDKQKSDLLQYVEENLKPENKYFWYLYFFNNCATIPRDLINKVLKGKIKQTYANQISDKKFRDYIRENLNRPPLYSFILDIIMNDRLDQPLSKWDEMFYPAKLREYLLNMPSFDDEGSPIVGTSLLAETKTIVNLEDYPSETWFLGPYFLFINMLGWVIGSLRLRNRKLGIDITSPSRLQLFLLAFWGLFSGLISLVMIIFWLFSYNLDMHHNANLVLLWPLDFCFFVFALICLIKKKTSIFSGWLYNFCTKLAKMHLVVIPIWVLSCLLGLISQNCNWVLIYIVPIALLNYIFLLSWNKAKNFNTGE